MKHKRVLVTGATGFIGSWIVKELHDNGYIIRAGVLDANNEAHTAHIRGLCRDNDCLTLFEIDLLNESNLDEAVKGCHMVFHVASPTDLRGIKDPEKEVIEPARQGTINLLNACERSGTVKRVILTSCISAMMFNSREPEKQFHLNDTDWSDENFLRREKKWYELSKTLSERAAWQFMEKGDRKFLLLTIQPGICFGPTLSSEVPYSLDLLRSFMSGDERHLASKRLPIVDVRDVAKAHLALAEKASMSKRYPCVGMVVNNKELFNCVKKCYPEAKHPEHAYDESSKIGMLSGTDCSKIQKLGVKWTSLHDTVNDSITAFRQFSLV